MKGQTTIIGIILGLFIGSSLYGQVFQHSEQKGISNEYSSALWVADSVFIVAENITILSGSTPTAALIAYDLFGTKIWEVAAPDTSELMRYQNLVSLSDTTFGVLGFFHFCCDCTTPEPFLEIRISENGELLNRIGQISVFNNSAFLRTDAYVSSNEWGFSTLSANFANSQIKYYSFVGEELLTFSLPNDFDINGDFQGDFLVASAEVIRRYDASGTQIDSVSIADTPTIMLSNDESLAVLTGSDLTLYDTNLDLITTLEFADDIDYLLSSFATGFVLYGGEVIHKIDNSGNLSEPGEFYEISGFEYDEMISNEEIFVVFGAKVSESYTLDNIKHRYSALRASHHEGGNQLWNTDLEITNLTIEELSVSAPDFIVIYHADVLVTVRNNGTFPVNSFYLNHAQSAGICYPFFQKLLFEEMIPNGGEITVSFPSISSWTLPGLADSTLVQPCVFVTQPNNEIDSDRNNDSGCASIYVFLSVDDLDVSSRVRIYPNPATKEIRIETDLLLESYQIFSGLGKLLQEGIANQGSPIALDDLPNGIYVVKLTTAEGVATKKVVVSR